VAADIEAALDVEVEIRDVPLLALLGELREGTIGFFRLGWQPDHPSAGAILEPLFHSRLIGEDNLTRFQNDDVDALLDQARATPDATERLALYGEVEALVLDLAPVAPIFFYPHSRVVAQTVEELRWSPIGTVDLARAWKALVGMMARRLSIALASERDARGMPGRRSPCRWDSSCTGHACAWSSRYGIP
jgi:ABC-type oligopeptide transport system substrate-binding subunit